MDIPVLLETDSFIVINKPPDIVVNRAESVKGETVQDFAQAYLHLPAPVPRNQTPGEIVPSEIAFLERAGVVHRIDKETSGCLLIAKNPEAFTKLQAQFKERNVKKSYLALVHGNVVPAEGEIRAPVGRLPWNREHFGIVPGGKEAVTRYKVVSVIPAPEPGSKKKELLSILELYPETGRTHQIRVHLKYINHPIVGDFQYAGRKTSRADRQWAPRVMLHAWKIVFTDPGSSERVAIEAPIPDDMKRVIGE